MTAESITVLFVDDDEQWVQYMAGELEAEDPAFSVTVAGNVNEAVLALDDDPAIDCVVTDYRMPEVDGIQLVEHIQESYPQLPFILVTGDGSEDIAARAIGAGVTDYIRKDPLADQAPIFVTRIRGAVDRARLRDQLRASERRYRTVIEHTRDGIVILQDDAIVFGNERFDDLCGSSVDTESTPLLNYIHEDDHDHVTDLIESAHSGDEPGLREVRLVRPTGEVRHCELLGEAITYEGAPGTLLSIRDVTRRRSRERTLKRERAFKQAVQQRLAGVHSREELESEITDVLASYGYDLVWIGSADDRGIHTRATAGDDEYISRLEADAGRDHGGDPICWAAQTGEAQYVPDFERLMPTTRRNDALDCGFRTGYALPLRHEELSSGILAVYGRDAHRIDEAERSLLTEIAATVSVAIHHVETQQTLTSSEGIVVEIELDSDVYYLSGLLAERFDHSAPELTVTGTQVIDEDTAIQYLSCSTDEPAAVGDALGDHPSVRSWERIDSSDPASYQVTVDADTPEAHLGAAGALVRSTTVTPGQATITFELASRASLHPAIDRLNESYGPVTVRSVVERTSGQSHDRDVGVDLDSLTAKQEVALEAAYHQGYFDRPRKRSAVDIAQSLGITHTTYLQHLRVAERKLFGQLFGGLSDATNRREQ
ncbi:MAG: response regulator [Euryarchaeota archaeon]|nr:response regulator [Euryarchaeota archaeon]